MSSFAERIRSFLRREDGVALPAAVGLLSVTLVLAGAAIQQAESAGDSADRDRSVKRALQAADAGLSAAVYRMNMFDINNIPDADPQCIAPGAGSALTLVAYSGDGWCPAVTEDLGSGASYSYRVSSAVVGSGQSQRTVVATGAVDGVQRRVATQAYAGRGYNIFGTDAVRSDETLTLASNSSIGDPAVRGNVRSNQNIVLSSNTRICGDARPGPGGTFSGPGQSGCAIGSTAPSPDLFALAPIDQGNARTVNDNYRICATTGVNRDTCTESSSISWSATTRRLSLNSGSTLTLTGSVYSFCQLTLGSNAELIIAARPDGSAVRIYIDHPEDCTGSPKGGFVMDSNTKIRNLNSNPVTLQMYVMGSRNSPPATTTVSFNSNATNMAIPMALYAPQSNVTLNSNTEIFGAVAAKRVTMDSNSQVHYSPLVAGMETSVRTRYGMGSYRECDTKLAGGEAPDARC